MDEVVLEIRGAQDFTPKLVKTFDTRDHHGTAGDISRPQTVTMVPSFGDRAIAEPASVNLKGGMSQGPSSFQSKGQAMSTSMQDANVEDIDVRRQSQGKRAA